MLKRTHTCGDLGAEQVGQTVILNGWVDAWRDFGGLAFIDLRDRFGVTQVVFEPEAGEALQDAARELRNEYVIGVKGTVARRLPARKTPSSRPGQIEVRAVELEVFNATQTPPFEIQGAEAGEELRLKYRFLDLRRPAMQSIFVLRHRMTQVMRNTMSRPRLPRRRDAHPRPQHARGGARLPRAEPRPSGPLLRPAAVAAVVQANPDGRRASTATSRSPAASATRTCEPTASRSSPSSTWRCHSSRTKTS